VIMPKLRETIIIISAYGEAETVQAAMAAGASGYLVKPVNDDQIVPALQAARERYATRESSGPSP